MELLNWVKDSWEVVGGFIILLALLLNKYIIAGIKRLFGQGAPVPPIPPTIPLAEVPLPPSGLFDEADDRSLSLSLMEQKANTVRQIEELKRQGKMLMAREKESNEDYKHQRKSIQVEKTYLGTRYDSLTRQLRILEDMITNQQKMSDEIQKLK